MTEATQDIQQKKPAEEINDTLKTEIQKTLQSMLPSKKTTSEKQLMHLAKAREAKKKKKYQMEIDEEHNVHSLKKMNKTLKGVEEDVKFLKRKHEDFDFKDIQKALKSEQNESATTAARTEQSKITTVTPRSLEPGIANQYWMLATTFAFLLGTGSYVYTRWDDSGAGRGGGAPNVYRI